MTFSREWDTQNAYLLRAAKNGEQHVAVPAIDIGDGYSIHCESHKDDNWLGTAKEEYYNIRHICAKK